MSLNSRIGNPESGTELTSALSAVLSASLALGCLAGLQAHKNTTAAMPSSAWEPVAAERTRDRTPNPPGANPRQHLRPAGAPHELPVSKSLADASNPLPTGSEQISH